MATVSHDPLALNWDLVTDLVPPEAEELLDPFADDDRLGLLALELSIESAPPAEPALPMGEWFRAQASYYRSLGGPLALFAAELLDSVADDARRHGADNLDDLAERSRLEEESYEAGLVEQARIEGFDAAMRAMEPIGYRHSPESVQALGEIRRDRTRETERLLRTYPG